MIAEDGARTRRAAARGARVPEEGVMRNRNAFALALAIASLTSLWTDAAVPGLVHYQGRLVSGTNLVNGPVSLGLRLYDAPAGGVLLYEDSNSVVVVDGLYNTSLGDNTTFGSLGASLTNAQVWLEAVVNGVALSPRERVASVAYALMADGVRTGGVTAEMIASGAVTAPAMADGSTLSELADDDGSGSGLDADLLDGLQASAFATGTPVYVEADTSSWRLAGNAGTSPGANFLGSTDFVPFEMRVNNDRVARFEPATNASGIVVPNVILGHSSNFAVAGISFGSTIGGGGAATQPNRVEQLFDTVAGGLGGRAAGGESFVGGGRRNSASAFRSVVAGGFSNTVRSGSAGGVIAGGSENEVAADSPHSVIGGGMANFISSNTSYSVIDGGERNVIEEYGGHNVIGGGSENRVLLGATRAVIGGGHSNRVEALPYGTIGGGVENQLQSAGNFSTIGGGEANVIGTNASVGTIAGGTRNRIGRDTGGAAIGGGDSNTIESNAINSVVGGGMQNVITFESRYSVIGGGRGNRLEYYANDTVIGGGEFNSVTTNSDHSVIGGGFSNTVMSGSRFAAIGGGQENFIGNNSGQSTVGGGIGNRIENDASDVVIGGGRMNSVRTFSGQAVLGGGEANIIATNAHRSVLAGGSYNTIQREGAYSVLGGGSLNTIGQSAEFATVGGGYQNEAGGISSTVPGGQNNWAANTLTFAAGNRAKALHTGSFVWGDGSNEDIESTNANSVTMRAVGGFRMITDTNLLAGAELPPGGGAWVALSDRASKENVEPVDPLVILEKVTALPITTWNYKSQDDTIRHIGPMAQDFHAAFGVGERPTGITTIDADGVALAAIQALAMENEKMRVQNAEFRSQNAEMRAELEALKVRLEAIETR